jgi:hypothetical protein
LPVRPITLQIGPFAILPLWLIQRCNDGDALRLYSWLGAKYCAGHDLECWPTQAILSEDLSRSIDRIQKDIKVLRDLGAVRTERVIGENGQLERLRYFLVQVDPTLNRENAVQGGDLSRESTATQPQNCGSNKEIQTQVPIPSTDKPISATEELHRRRPDLRPEPLKPRKRKGKHATHVFCGNVICVDQDKHARFENRIRAAGGNPDEIRLLDDADGHGLYFDWDQEFEGTDHPNFYLEKRFAAALKEEFGEQ